MKTNMNNVKKQMHSALNISELQILVMGGRLNRIILLETVRSTVSSIS